MNTLLTSTFTILATLGVNNAIAAGESDYNYAFDTGSAIIYCAPPSGESVLPTDTFNKAFPKWIPSLQAHVEKGTVSRVHFLNEFNKGIFVLVHGESPAQAMENAVAINNENRNILKQAALDTGYELEFEMKDVCQLLPIGPQIIGPQ